MAENDDVDTKPNMFAISSRDLFRLKRKRSEEDLLDDKHKLSKPKTTSTGSPLNDEPDVLPPASEVSVSDATELSGPKTNNTGSSLNDEHDVLPPAASEVSILDEKATELSEPKTKSTGSPLNDEHGVDPPAASEVSVIESSSFVHVSSLLCRKQEYLVSMVIAIHNKLDAHLCKLIDNSVRPRIVNQLHASWYKDLLTDIHNSIRFQRYTTQHLCDFFSVETAASIAKETKDCSVDKDPNSRKPIKCYSYLGIRNLKERHQNVLNLNRELVEKLTALQEHFKTPQSNKLNSKSAISRYREMLNDLECSWRCAFDATWYFFGFPMGATGVVESPPPTNKKSVPVPVSCGVGVGFAKGFAMYSSTINEFSKLSLDSRVGF